MEENKLDWLEEQNRVEHVKEVIQKKKRKLTESARFLKEKVLEIRKTFWEDVTVNIDELDDVYETQVSIKQQAELLSERERSHGQASKQLKILDRLNDSPYFGRIDFQEEGEDVESIYIGIASLMDENDENFLIYDWRAPISSLYYDYAPGPAQYETMDRVIKGEMKLKRQFIIRQGKIKGMFDTGLTIGDHLLQKMLGRNASTKMKSIVATIQKEQNKIIRNDKAGLLVVQGVAGSGKTSAALQRVAYLLYRYRESITSDNIMLFSPNPLFNSYVSTVLPELGEENMKQTTFQEHAEERLGNDYKLETPFDQMEYYLTKNSVAGYKARVEGIRFKASMDFKKMMDAYITFLSAKGFHFKNINFRGEIIISKEEIGQYFYSLDKKMTIPTRMEMVSKWILEKVTQKEKEEFAKDWVLMEANLMNKEDYVKVFDKLSSQNYYSEDTFDDFDKEEEMLRRLVIRRKFKPLRQQIEKLQFINIKAVYAYLFKEWSLEQTAFPLPGEWPEICLQTLNSLKRNFLFYEDVSPYLYLLDKIVGTTVNRTVRHVLIDEAQDYSPFQFAYIKGMYPNSRITLLGDFNQAIHAHTLENESLLTTNLEEKMERVVLTNSYRSTEDIVEFTKDIIPNGEMIQPFSRNGDKPSLKIVNSDYELFGEIISTVKQYAENGYETIAVVCKTLEESNNVYHELKKHLLVKLIGPDAKTFEKGILVIPVYVAKGIEFDAVIIPNVSAEVYGSDAERNLLYTACTRAMHSLTLFSLGTPSHIIEGINKNKYLLNE
jgi:DNA helicase II / ATP-dependent DNA helicase PcrA